MNAQLMLGRKTGVLKSGEPMPRRTSITLLHCLGVERYDACSRAALPEWPPQWPDLNPFQNIWKIVRDFLLGITFRNFYFPFVMGSFAVNEEGILKDTEKVFVGVKNSRDYHE